MPTLTETQRSSLRRKVGDPAGDVWTADELNTIFTEAGGDINEAIAICFEELMVDAAKFADYKQNESEEKRSQIFNNLAKLADRYRGLSNSQQSQVRIVGMKQRPPRNKRIPRDQRSRKRNRPIGWD